MSANALTALGEVESTITFVKTLANDAYSTAQVLLERITAVVDIGDVNTSVELADITLPDISSSLGTLPTAPDLGDLPVQPPLVFDFNESAYTSTLGDLLDAALRDELENGSTGLTATIENDIYNREDERDLQALADAKARMASLWAATNSPVPDACLYALQTYADVQYQNRKSDKSRDVRIESFKRADDNARFVKELSARYEGVIREYTGKYWERQLQKSKEVLNYGIQVYEALIKWKTALIDLYKGQAQAYEAQVKGVAALADVQVAIYDAHTRKEVAAANVAIESIRSQIELLRGKVQAVISAAGSIGQVASHLASGALSALHAGATVDYRGSESEESRTSVSTSTDYRESHSYEEKKILDDGTVAS